MKSKEVDTKVKELSAILQHTLNKDPTGKTLEEMLLTFYFNNDRGFIDLHSIVLNS